MAVLNLLKYEATGNDFLLVVDQDGAAAIDPVLVTALCDRHRGIGADGVIRISRPVTAGAIAMELYNSDGGIAETSGNGLRCLALAAVHEKLVAGPTFVIETAAGPVEATVSLEPFARATVRISMGEVRLVADRHEVVGCAAYGLNIGNPHLVVFVGDHDGPDLDTLGPKLDAAAPAGTNVEFVKAGSVDDEIMIDTWERGAGRTLACGSGSCAAAFAAYLVGLVGQTVIVENPGGSLTVELSDTSASAASVSLTGPVARVAQVLIEPGELLADRGATV